MSALLLQQIEADQLTKLTANKRIDKFEPGDTVKVNVRIIEGESERLQAFEGICIAKKNRGIHSSFTLRKISHGEGVERVFPLFSPRLESVELIRRGDVRRAKLYYLRGLTGKKARIREKMDWLTDKNTAAAAKEAAANTAADGSALVAAPKKPKAEKRPIKAPKPKNK